MISSPEPSLLQDMEAQAREWALGAGRILMEYYQRPLEVEFKKKGRRSPVTAADRAAQEFLLQAIHRAYPEHGFLGEEMEVTGGTEPDFLWVVDPLDGTSNFINGLPIFAVSIGALYRRRPVVGCILAPSSPQLGEGVYHCHRGGGTFLEGQSLSVAPGLSPEKLASLPASFFFHGKPTKELRAKLGEGRSLGSIACDMALVAKGTLHLAYFGSPRIWDVAAGALLVKEAGGEVLTTQQGRWESLEEFTPLRKKKDQGLSQWSASVIASSREGAWFFARNLRWRGFLSHLLRAWL